MSRTLRFLLPVLVLLGGIAIAASLIATGPKTKRQRPEPAPPTVEIMTLQRQNYQVRVASQGTLSPRTSTILVAEVSGRIIEVADTFRNGGFFAKGDQLLQIDPRDYENVVTIARAELSQRQLSLAEEQARTEQARRNWDKLQMQGEPTPLTLRVPQLENARAAVAAASARLRQAEIELERTRILAPYAGRILEKKADLGQYVAPGSALVSIYASDSVEIRLPITSEQQSLLDLPETSAEQQTRPRDRARVEFTARIGERQEIWPGRLIRTEGSIDVRSRQLFVVARIDNPYQRHSGRSPLKIGQFLTASIYGNQLEQVFVIPRRAVRGEKTVHLIDTDNRLRRRELDLLWKDDQNLIASGPLNAGDRLSLTTLAFAADGIKVQIAGEEPAKKNPKPEKGS